MVIEVFAIVLLLVCLFVWIGLQAIAKAPRATTRYHRNGLPAGQPQGRKYYEDGRKVN